MYRTLQSGLEPKVLFDKISFSIAEGQKVGLVARNGTGKSTLMSVLMNKEGYENGDIIYRRDLKIGYLEQSPDFDPRGDCIGCLLQS